MLHIRICEHINIAMYHIRVQLYAYVTRMLRMRTTIYVTYLHMLHICYVFACVTYTHSHCLDDKAYTEKI